MSMDGQGTKRRRKIAEDFNRLSRTHQRYRQTNDRETTDGQAIAYSEREREFTFANKTILENSQTLHMLLTTRAVLSINSNSKYSESVHRGQVISGSPKMTV